jgi:hypothetical protein
MRGRQAGSGRQFFDLVNKNEVNTPNNRKGQKELKIKSGV